MEIRQLRYFAAIVEEGTVTGAARRLNMTQPPLTAQIRSLEEELGCRLFVHEGRRLRLTEAGRALYRRADTILGLCDAAAAEMGDYRAGTAGTLRLGAVSSVRGTVFLQWLEQFAARYPQVQYDLYSADTYQQLEQLRAGQLDLAIVRTPFSAPELEVLPLRRESMVAVGRAAHFGALPAGPVTLRELAGRPLILYRRWESILRGRFEAAGCVPQIRCRNDEAQTTLALAARGLGIGLMPASALPAQPDPALQLHPIADPALTTQIAAVCRDKRRLPQAARLFWAMLEEQAGASGTAAGR